MKILCEHIFHEAPFFFDEKGPVKKTEAKIEKTGWTSGAGLTFDMLKIRKL